LYPLSFAKVIKDVKEDVFPLCILPQHNKTLLSKSLDFGFEVCEIISRDFEESASTSSFLQPARRSFFL